MDVEFYDPMSMREEEVGGNLMKKNSISKTLSEKESIDPDMKSEFMKRFHGTTDK